MSTKAQLRAAIKLEARVKVASNLDTMIDTLMAEILTDYGNRALYREVLTLNSPLTLVDAQADYALPANFQHLSQARFSVQGTTFYPVIEFNQGQNRISTVGFPRYYALSAAGITLFPSSLIVTSNTFFLDYYRDPASLFVADGDNFPIPRLESTIKKAVMARLVKYMQNFKELPSAKADESDSFTASQAGQ